MIYRAFLILAACLGVSWLKHEHGTLPALACWAAGAGLACLIGAILLRCSPVGRVGWQNYLAGTLLPWGYRVGCGKLWPIVVVSWLVWVLIGIASTVHLDWSDLVRFSPGVWSLLLLVCWIIHGMSLLYLVGTLVKFGSLGSKANKTIIKLILIVMALFIVSLILHLNQLDFRAVLVAGGPFALIAGGYGLFLLVILTVGRNARWN